MSEAPQAYCLGELMWDLHAREQFSKASDYRAVAGGAAANVAFELVADGTCVAIGGVLSRDPLGQALRTALLARGIQVDCLMSRAGRTGLVFIEPGSVAQRFVSYQPTIGRYPARLPLPWRGHSAAARVLHLASVPPQLPALRSLRELLVRARASQAWISVDLNARPQVWKRARGFPKEASQLLSQVHLLKASVEDLRTAGLAEDAATLRECLLPEGVAVVTRGPGLTTVAHPRSVFSLRPPAVRARRAVAAGDAFCSAILRALLESAPPGPRSLSFWRRTVKAAQHHAARRLTEPLF